ncbi:MAG: hypothetical protein WDZ64_01710 [Parcubacteria group bacterium]
MVITGFVTESNAQTRTWAEMVSNIYEEEVAPQFNIFTGRNITAKNSVFLFATVTDEWAEALIGFSTSPRSGVEISLGVGIETHEKPWRSLLSVWLGNNKRSLLMMGEKGGSGNWYMLVASETIHPNLKIGAHAQRFVGIGPRLDIRLKESLNFWIVPVAWDFENNGAKSAVLALNVTIQ